MTQTSRLALIGAMLYFLRRWPKGPTKNMADGEFDYIPPVTALVSRALCRRIAMPMHSAYHDTGTWHRA
eukprot:2339840-Rhodomonas_salina.3